jgi:lysophospholipase L1-like esterase
MPAVATPPRITNVSPKARRGPLHAIGESAIVLLLTLLMLELVFGLAGVGESTVLQIDKTTGYIPVPGKHITWRMEGFSRSRLNSFGMNNAEVPLAKPPGTTRIAVMGDSLVQAMEVDRKENFCNKLADKLNTDSANKIDVLNFGVQAYNLGQMYLRMKTVAMQFHPDIVILPIRVDATLIIPPGPGGGFIFARPNFFVKPDGTLLEDRQVQNQWLGSPEGKRMRATDWLRGHTHLWGIVQDSAAGIICWYEKIAKEFKSPGKPAKVATTPMPVINQQPTPEQDGCTKYWWPVADALIGQMEAECKKANCKLVIVRLAFASRQTNPLETKLVKETAAKRNIPCCDLTDAFFNAPNRDQLFYTNHMTPAGHELVANQLEQFLRGSSIVSAPR